MRYDPSAADLQRYAAIQRVVGEIFDRVRFDFGINSVDVARAVVARLPPELVLYCATEFIADELLGLADEVLAGADI
jgi:hypothetical protein